MRTARQAPASLVERQVRAPTGGGRTTVIRPRARGLLHAARETFRFRWCISYVGRLLLQKRYSRTWLGWVWLPLRPCLAAASRILVFGGIVGITSHEAPYPIFFLVAMAGWQLFAETAFWATRSLEVARTMTRTIEVPRLPALLGALLPGSVEFVIYSLLAVAAVLWYVARAGIVYVDLGWHNLLVLGGLALILLLGLGIGLLTAAIGARARDVRFGLMFGLSFLYYLTPVLYPLSIIPNKYRPLAELNPMTGAIEMLKDGIFASHELSPDAVMVTVAAVLALWIPGLWLFHRADIAFSRGRPSSDG
jgi:lipopolysaccharide transport system permease protein